MPLPLPSPSPLDAAAVAAIVRDRLPPALVVFLPGQRWYGDKARELAAVDVVDVAVSPADGPDRGRDWFALAVIAIRFADGGEEARYFLPLALAREAPAAAAPLAVVETPTGSWSITEAINAAAFPAWLLTRFELEAVIEGDSGRFAWLRFPAFAAANERARAGPVRVGGAEQSNSAIRYDEAIFVKVFRRLRAGINPDEEVSRFLAERTAFRRLPIPLGEAAYVAADGDRSPAALAFSFVPSVGDGWGWTLDALAAFASGSTGTPDPPVDYAAAARRLGERTAQLHLALASDATDPAFAPEPVTEADTRAWQRTVAANLDRVAADLRARAGRLPAPVRERIGALPDRMPDLAARAAGFRSQLGTVRTRVHGDYHLGQVLRTPDDDWVILDFEGEPARPIAERRAKTSPLKDVAGMLRSFEYARGAALRAVPTAGDLDAARRRLAAWAAATRDAFLAGYQGEVSRSTVPLVPADDAAFAAAIAAWELDKTLYEVEYELGNRPTWLDLPLSGLV